MAGAKSAGRSLRRSSEPEFLDLPVQRTLPYPERLGCQSAVSPDLPEGRLDGCLFYFRHGHATAIEDRLRLPLPAQGVERRFSHFNDLHLSTGLIHPPPEVLDLVSKIQNAPQDKLQLLCFCITTAAPMSQHHGEQNRRPLEDIGGADHCPHLCPPGQDHP